MKTRSLLQPVSPDTALNAEHTSQRHALTIGQALSERRVLR